MHLVRFRIPVKLVCFGNILINENEDGSPMDEFFIPTLHTFAMKNTFTGSSGEFRFRITPNIQTISSKEVDFDASTIVAEYWHGPFCYEKSTVEDAKTFPLSEAGRADMIEWLQSCL